MKWTPWRVWIHPFLASDRLEEAENVETDLKKRLDEILKLLEQQRKETAIQTFRTSELSRQLAEVEKKFTDEHRELEETRIQLYKALDTLAEQKTVDEKLREFDKQLSQIEAMKRKYEKRITELEARLADARRRLALADDNELVEPIDMLEEKRQRTIAIKKREKDIAAYEASTRRADRSTDKDTSVSPDTPGNKTTAPAEKKAGHPGDDWLVDLPNF